MFLINSIMFNRDEIYDSNMQKIIDCINLVSRFGDPHPMVQMKLTAIMPTDLCVRDTLFHSCSNCIMALIC